MTDTTRSRDKENPSPNPGLTWETKQKLAEEKVICCYTLLSSSDVTWCQQGIRRKHSKSESCHTSWGGRLFLGFSIAASQSKGSAPPLWLIGWKKRKKADIHKVIRTLLHHLGTTWWSCPHMTTSVILRTPHSWPDFTCVESSPSLSGAPRPSPLLAVTYRRRQISGNILNFWTPQRILFLEQIIIIVQILLIRAVR